MQISSNNPDVEKPLKKNAAEASESFQGDLLNEKNRANTVVEKDPTTKDFYNGYDPYKVNSLDRDSYKKYYDGLNEEEKKQLQQKKNFYEVSFEAIGGLVMPIILSFEFEDGSTQKEYIPAEIWRFNQSTVSKVFIFDKEVKQINLDPNLETADTDRSNNYWPEQNLPSRFTLFKEAQKEKENEMQKAKRAK